MVMPITEIEKRVYEEKIQLLKKMDLKEWASISFSDKLFRLIFIKAVHNLVEESGNTKKKVWSESILLDDNNAAKGALEEILLEMVSVASVPKKGRTLKVKFKEPHDFKGYSTGQLAAFFSVSTTTINNWINEGRFLRELDDGSMIKVERKALNEKIKVHPEFWFDAPSGVRYQVKEAVAAYEEDLEEWEKSKQENTVNEQKQISAYIEHFKNKYDGKDFNTVFGDRDWDNLTAEEETDAAMWSFFIQRLTNGEDTGN
ncbi:hypothetical protein [Fredinandcohnia sp. 179-A 10B2 NHS]|uniref:hypothetical protein n=1 Tax=Fredinandcohnia sp. 179-A 10B2 NHS TaxID=3235176 RepID=UPI00399F4A99